MVNHSFPGVLPTSPDRLFPRRTERRCKAKVVETSTWKFRESPTETINTTFRSRFHVRGQWQRPTYVHLKVKLRLDGSHLLLSVFVLLPVLKWTLLENLFWSDADEQQQQQQQKNSLISLLLFYYCLLTSSCFNGNSEIKLYRWMKEKVETQLLC